MSYCGCEDEGRDAYRYDQYSYDTQQRPSRGR